MIAEHLTPGKEPTAKHVAIAEFIALNPEMKLADVARHFHISQAWLSTLKNTDAFREMLANRQDALYAISSQTVATKLTVLAEMAVDKLIELTEVEVEPKELRASAEMALDRIGYSGASRLPVGGVNVYNQQNNFYPVEPDALARARQRMLARQGLTIEHMPEMQDAADSPAAPVPAATAPLPSSGDRPNSRHITIPATFPNANRSQGPTGGGRSLRAEDAKETGG